MTCAGNTIDPYGSSFDDFLAEHGILEETHNRAVKSVLAWQLRQALDEAVMTKSEFARRLPAAPVNRRPSDE